MNKAQFFHDFWSRFEWPAYDESTVPEVGENQAKLPYITYMVMEDEFDHPVFPGASLWDYGTTWKSVEEKAKEISEAIGYGGFTESIDGGYVWIQRGHPFAQRLSDNNDNVRRIALNIEVEFLTAN
jgi:hypothetical protein